jgi:hypothetical protein
LSAGIRIFTLEADDWTGGNPGRQSATFSLALPSIPQGTLIDVDNNGQSDTGVQIFAVAYWSNTWGGPFLEDRDGTGWSTAYASTLVDPEQDNEIIGGTLVVWAPDDQQSFPTGFGPDGRLFTADDPTAPIPPGYTLVDLDQNPFRIFKEANPQLALQEGELAVNDYSEMSYTGGLRRLFEKAARNIHPGQRIDWQKLHDEFAPRYRGENADDFYRAIRTSPGPYQIHFGISLNAQVFYEAGGSFGLILSELSDGKVIVTEVHRRPRRAGRSD